MVLITILAVPGATQFSLHFFYCVSYKKSFLTRCSVLTLWCFWRPSVKQTNERARAQARAHTHTHTHTRNTELNIDLYNLSFIFCSLLWILRIHFLLTKTEWSLPCKSSPIGIPKVYTLNLIQDFLERNGVQQGDSFNYQIGLNI